MKIIVWKNVSFTGIESSDIGFMFDGVSNLLRNLKEKQTKPTNKHCYFNHFYTKKNYSLFKKQMLLIMKKL